MTAAKRETKAEPKNPWIAGALNFFLPGLGYLYVGKPKRAAFSAGLIVAAVFLLIGSALLRPEIQLEVLATSIVGELIFGIAFAWDAYKDAKETQG